MAVMQLCSVVVWVAGANQRVTIRKLESICPRFSFSTVIHHNSPEPSNEWQVNVLESTEKLITADKMKPENSETEMKHERTIMSKLSTLQ